MATPASDATSPSPPIPYLSHTPIPHPAPLSTHDPHERDVRKQAVQKFLARAEISMVTRALRARLSYASYKALHNVSHVPIRELEGQLLSQSQAASFNRTIAAKRKSAGASSSQYSNSSSASSTGPMAPALNAHVRRHSANMPPPTATASSPRAHHSTVSSGSQTRGSSSAQQQQSLYSSILAPPPSHVVARTVLNAHDPPVPPPSRPAPSPRVRSVKPSPKSTADGTRTHSKAKQPDKKTVASPERRKAKRASLDNKGKAKQRSRVSGREGDPVDADGDVDMKAAATLTSLLMHHHSRSSIHGSTHSPRSSFDGSETGSTYSYSQSFAQSSARSTTATSPPGSISSANAMMGVSPSAAAETSPSAYSQQQTPPPGPIRSSHSSGSSGGKFSTPRPTAPTDNEAADLMLFLATSPSPARPTPKQRDPASYRTLGGNDSGALRSKGRILFPSASAPDVMVHDDPMPQQPTTLARTSDGNYIGQVEGGGSRDLHGTGVSRTLSSSSSSMITPGQLLPPPSLPSSQSSTSPQRVPDSPLRGAGGGTNSPKAGFGSGGGTPSGVVEFNFNEFINASPSPSRPTPTQGQGQGHRQNSSMRADVGRKLFEEEQMRYLHSSQQQQQERSPGKGGLAAGIDIVHT